MSKKATYTAVTYYRTADGEDHATQKAAQEHAEYVAGHRLSELMCQVAGDHLSGTVYHKIVCHMLRNCEKYAQVFNDLCAFDEDEENDE
jgi:hypothetical protein